MDCTQDWQQQVIALHLTNTMSRREIARCVGKKRSTVLDFIRGYESAKRESDESLEAFDKYAFEPVPEMERNSRILFISDMHIPYHHPNTVPFLRMLKERYNPTRIVCLGDECDKHALSFWSKDPDLLSAGDELKAALPVIAEIHELFPEMTILDSNHGSLVWRKAKEHGIPRHYIKSYNDVLGVGKGWKWVEDLVLTLPDGQKVFVHHGKSADAIKTSQAMGMSHVCGHYHNSFGVKYWANPQGLYWAMNGGCLIDDSSLAFAYNNVNLHRPIIGTCLLIDGVPILEAMPL